MASIADSSTVRPYLLHSHLDTTHAVTPILPVANPTASFWHREPVLQGHRTTPELPRSAKYVIIGSGITGTSAAYYVSTLGNGGEDEVPLVLEAREACWGATGRNGGHMQALITADSPETFLFESATSAEVARIIQAEGIKCEYRRAPACCTLWDPQLAKHVAEALEHTIRSHPELDLGMHNASREELASMYMDVEKCPGGYINSGAASSLWPYKLVTGLLQNLIARGQVNLQTNTPVLSVTPTADKKWLVETQRGAVLADAVLLATNAWSGYLLPTPLQTLIQPCRGTMSAITPPAAWGGKRLPGSYGLQSFNGTHNNDYLTHRPNVGDADNATGGGREQQLGGQLMLGGGDLARSYDDSQYDEVNRAYLAKLLPATMATGSDDDDDELTIEQLWTGVWGQSLDAAPWVGAVPLGSGEHRGLFMCGGYTGHGMPNATGCARAAVKLMRAYIAGNKEQAADEAEEQRLEASKELPAIFLVSEARVEKAKAFGPGDDMVYL